MPQYPRELSIDEIVLDITPPPRIDVDTLSSPSGTTAGSSTENRWAFIGQDRAMKALEMGISIRAKGYNIFVAGDPGIGKHTAVTHILSGHLKKNGSLRDIVYVQDFGEPDKPKTLSFPEGEARQFKKDIEQLVDRLSDHISRDLDTEAYKAKRDTLIAEREKAENKILSDFESRLSAEGFRTVQTSDEEEGQSTDIAPVIEGEVLLFEDLQDLVSSGKLPETVWNETRERYFAYMDAMKRIYRDLRIAREKLDKKLTSMKIKAIRAGVEDECSALAEKWKDGQVGEYLKSLENDVLENPDWFTADDEDDEERDLSVRYGVNIVVDRHEVKELPVIHETNPTKVNLFGAIEARYDVSGELRTNMMMIKAGSLLLADGGFLILQAEDVFSKEGLWPELKRALQTGHVVPEVQSTPLGPLPILMKPEPVTAETTVILIGPARIYETLCTQDEEFRKLFKVAAEFSSVMPRNPTTEQEYAAFAAGLVKKEDLKPFTPDGIRELIAYGVMLAEKRDRLSTRFSLVGDLIREANYVGTKANREEIDGKTVREAIDAREYMGNLPEEMLNEQIRDGQLIIDVKGERIGSVNGLAVLERGFYAFGTPLRITVAVGPGKDGLINIERESGLSGELHDKGVFLLEGYLRFRFARRMNLSLTASIAVEQSYYEIDGDSASAAELAALLSAIGELPLRQGLAVTGAVNQQGVLHPVGGIHEKVQGFFNACRSRGFTGDQGVIVPARNLSSAVLPNHIIEAVKDGRFHIWAAETIDDVMVLLTGMNMNAGRERRRGRFEMNSINERVRRGLVELADIG